MRHLSSFLLAVIFAPAVLILTGRGVGWFTDATAAQPTDQLAMLFALGALVLAGALYALLTLPRLSPLGPVVAGGAYLGVGLWALADLAHLTANVPGELLGLDDAMVAAIAAVSPLLAVPLLATGYSPRRWRGRSAEAEVGAPAPGHPPASPPPSYPDRYPASRPLPYRPTPTVVMPAAWSNDQPTEPIPLVPAPGAVAADPGQPSGTTPQPSGTTPQPHRTAPADRSGAAPRTDGMADGPRVNGVADGTSETASATDGTSRTDGTASGASGPDRAADSTSRTDDAADDAAGAEVGGQRRG